MPGTAYRYLINLPGVRGGATIVEGTRIGVQVEIPEEEAKRLDDQREIVSRSLGNLARLAAAE